MHSETLSKYSKHRLCERRSSVPTPANAFAPWLLVNHRPVRLKEAIFGLLIAGWVEPGFRSPSSRCSGKDHERPDLQPGVAPRTPYYEKYYNCVLFGGHFVPWSQGPSPLPYQMDGMPRTHWSVLSGTNGRFSSGIGGRVGSLRNTRFTLFPLTVSHTLILSASPK